MREWTLFDAPAAPTETFNGDALDWIAILYTSTEKGNTSGIRFAMSVEDAKAFCESAVSRGTLYGTNWAYFWTTARNYVACHGGRIDLRSAQDDGSWDGRIGEFGKKIELDELSALLRSAGVEVLR